MKDEERRQKKRGFGVRGLFFVLVLVLVIVLVLVGCSQEWEGWEEWDVWDQWGLCEETCCCSIGE